MRVIQIGSSLKSDTPNDFDLLVVSDIPVDICLYTTEQWEIFKQQGQSSEGRRVVIHPPKPKSFQTNAAELTREQK